MKDFIYIGSAPCEEDCVQVGMGDYYPKMKAECDRFKEALEKAYPPPDGARLSIKNENHEFGPYLEVIVRYDDEDEEATEYAFMLESEAAGTWKELERLAERGGK